MAGRVWVSTELDDWVLVDEILISTDLEFLHSPHTESRENATFSARYAKNNILDIENI